jgi:hypothetical protein
MNAFVTQMNVPHDPRTLWCSRVEASGHINLNLAFVITYMLVLTPKSSGVPIHVDNPSSVDGVNTAQMQICVDYPRRRRASADIIARRSTDSLR